MTKKFILDSMAFFTGNSTKFLMAVLNSSLIHYWVKINVHQYGDNGFRLSNQYVEQIPIPRIDEKEQGPFIEKVDKIIELKKAGKETKDLEEEIDNMVYKLYELNEEEIKIVEGKS